MILDASWSSSEWRAEAVRVAEETASDLVELRCDAPRGVDAERVAQRLTEGVDVSDADARVAAVMRAVFDRWPSFALALQAVDPGFALAPGKD